MKFDRLMKIYWSKGLYYDKKLIRTKLNFKNFFIFVSGISKATKLNFLKRFEINYFTKELFFTKWKINKNKIINNYTFLCRKYGF